MRFEFIDQAKKEFPVHRLCDVLGVSESGYFAWKGHSRPHCPPQSESLSTKPGQVHCPAWRL
jgi:putative transposase